MRNNTDQRHLVVVCVIRKTFLLLSSKQLPPSNLLGEVGRWGGHPNFGWKNIFFLAERNFHSYFRRLNILELSELTLSQRSQLQVSIAFKTFVFRLRGRIQHFHKTHLRDTFFPCLNLSAVHILITTSLFHTERQGQNTEDRVGGCLGCWTKNVTKRGISMTINIPAVGVDTTKEAVNQFNEAPGHRLSPRRPWWHLYQFLERDIKNQDAGLSQI